MELIHWLFNSYRKIASAKQRFQLDDKENSRSNNNVCNVERCFAICKHLSYSFSVNCQNMTQSEIFRPKQETPNGKEIILALFAPAMSRPPFLRFVSLNSIK